MDEAPFDLVDMHEPFADTDWFHTCRQTQTPYVVVRSGETTADVLWDYVTLPPSCDAEWHRNRQALEREAQAIFERFAEADSNLRVKPTMICFDRLPFAQAKRAATELYYLIASSLSAIEAARSRRRDDDGAVGETPVQRPEAAPSTPRRLWVEESRTSHAA